MIVGWRHRFQRRAPDGTATLSGGAGRPPLTLPLSYVAGLPDGDQDPRARLLLGIVTGTLSPEEARALALAIDPAVTSIANPEMGEEFGGESTLPSDLAALVKAYYDALGADADPAAAAAAVRLGFFPPGNPVELARLVFDLTAGRLADAAGIVEAGAHLARALESGDDDAIEAAVWDVLAAAAFLPLDKIGRGAIRLLKGGTRLGIETLQELTRAARAGGRALGEAAGSTGTAVSRAVTEGVEAAASLAREAGARVTDLARQGTEALARAWRETRQQLDEAFDTWRRKGPDGTAPAPRDKPDLPAGGTWTPLADRTQRKSYWSATEADKSWIKAKPGPQVSVPSDDVTEPLLEQAAKERPSPPTEADPIPLLTARRDRHLASGREADAWWPPYAYGLPVYRTETANGERFVRVFGGDSPLVGTWLMRENDLKHADGSWLSADEIADKFALPKAPSHMTIVEAPPGTTLYVSVAGPSKTRPGGGVQFEFRDWPRDMWFGQAVAFPPVGGP